MFKSMLLLFILIVFSGCASYIPNEDGTFTVRRTPLCNFTVHETYAYNEKGEKLLMSRFVSSNSNTNEVLQILKEAGDFVIGAGKAIK